MNFFKNRTIIALSTLAFGLLLGWLIFGGGSKEEHSHAASDSGKATTWTCSMHPQIKQPEPGDCPICGMDLIPLGESSSEDSPLILEMTDNAIKLANIQTSIVSYGGAEKAVTLNGKINFDERKIYSQTAHIAGRVEELYVSFVGEQVRKGQVIAEVYSPQLISAQEELLQSDKLRETVPELFESARKKLKFWKIADKQIDYILSSGSIQETFEIYADVSGYVTERRLSLGDQVKTGDVLFKIADLSKLWIEFEVYERDLQWVKTGEKVEFTVASFPGDKFYAVINYVDPIIDPQTRIAAARAEIANHGGKFKPQMFVKGIVHARLRASGSVLAVPKTAVMWTGTRSVVYIKLTDRDVPSFEAREVELGQDLGSSFVVNGGLAEGDEVVTNGTFNVDAAAQLNNKYSMMNREVNIKGNKKEAFADVPDFKDAGDKKFRNKLKSVVEHYLKLNAALVQSDYKTSSAHIKELMKSIDKLVLKTSDKKAHDFFMTEKEIIKEKAALMAGADDIETQRAAYLKLSESLIRTVLAFGVDAKLWLQYCPMADNDKGGYWLSAQEEILNPYFGDKMLRCGEVKKVIDK